MKRKKIFYKLCTGFLFIFTLLFLFSTSFAFSVIAAEDLVLDQDTLSMTETREITLEAKFDYEPELNNLYWYFGKEEGALKPFEEWKSWEEETEAFSGEQFINFIEEPTVENNTIVAKVEVGLKYGTENLSPRNIRGQYLDNIGNYEFLIRDKSTGVTVAENIYYNAYESFLTWDEIQPTIEEIIDKAKGTRFLEYKILGESAEGREIPLIALARDEETLNRYQNEKVPLMLEDPAQLQEKLAEGELEDYQIPIWFHNTHPDEAPAVDGIMELMRVLATEDTVSFKAPLELERYTEYEETTINIDELLDDIIFIFTPTRNPDGRYHNLRGTPYEQMDPSSGAFDLNRDASYQTQVESRHMSAELSSWLPIVFLDLHGFYYPAVVDLLTPPHDPNYEYDLVSESMALHPFSMGETMLANTYYEEYVVPGIDWDYGWDDSSAIYSPTYAMHFGALLSHTPEVQELNQETVWSTFYIGLGSALYVQDEKDELYQNQLEYYRRGVENVDKRTVDEHFVSWPDLEPVGRDREPYDNFFPEYYVIPVDEELQINSLEAYNMVEYLLRNGIKVEELTEETVVNDTIYPEGTYIIPMNQAFRGLVNTLLYDGPDHSEWPALYAETIQNFHHMWGFNRDEIREEKAFAEVTEEIESVNIPTTEIPVEAENYILKNVNNDAIRAVNYLLSQDKQVEMLIEGGEKHKKGDYLISQEALNIVYEDHFLEIELLEDNVQAKPLSQAKVAVAGTGVIPAKTRFVLEEQLNFNIVKPEEADVIIDVGGHGERKWIDEGKSYIGIEGGALDWAENNLPELTNAGFKWEQTSPRHEGVIHSTLDSESIILSGYESEELMYINSGAWISSAPDSARVIAHISEEDDFFIAGFWSDRDQARGGILAMQDWIGGSHITLFANSLTNKAHTRYYYRMLANSIFNTYLPKNIY